MNGGWSSPGELPEIGTRYEWSDFVGATWIGTLTGWESVQMEDVDGRPCVGLSLSFSDHAGFETNLPVAFRHPA